MMVLYIRGRGTPLYWGGGNRALYLRRCCTPGAYGGGQKEVKRGHTPALSTASSRPHPFSNS